MCAVNIINNVTKEYPDMFKIVIYHEGKLFFTNENGHKRKVLSSADYTPCVESVRRTKVMVHDIVYCNRFDYFATFTFSPDKVDRYNIDYCKYLMTKWLNNQRYKNSPDLKYLVIPELHKDGAIHFHAMLGNFNGKMVDSGHKKDTRTIFNIKGWRNGFSTAVKIDNIDAVSKYVTKYITKDFVRTYNKRRFFCSRNLVRPKKTSNSPVFRQTLPIFRKCVFQGYDYDLYEIEKYSNTVST